MMIFFLTGRLLRIMSITEKLKISGLPCVIGWFAYGYFVWCYPDLALGYVSCKWYMYTVILAMAGCLLSLYTVMVWQMSFLTRFGVASMGIMLTHKFFIMPIQLYYGRLTTFGTIVVILVVIASLVIVSLVSYGVTVVIRRYTPLIVGERR